MIYTKDKSGKVRYWDGQVINENNIIYIVKKFGQVGGKETETRTEIKSGKNIGKKNETTPWEQAHLELKSLIKKQKEAGYVDSVEELDNRVVILPMLANKWEEMSHFISEPFIVQPKLDGVRMLLGRYQGTLLMLSRTGKPIRHMDHIAKEWEWIPEGLFLDGESYNHNITFEEITGMCRTSLESSASSKPLHMIQFHVFDLFDLNHLKQPFYKRWEALKKIFEQSFVYSKMVPTRIIHSKNLIEEEHSRFTEMGYEGIMIRHIKSPYTLGERSNHLLKLKYFETAEYKIVGAEEAKGRDIGTVVWVCETSGGRRFSVRPQGTQAERRQWLRDKNNYIGKWLTVKYQNLSSEKIPRFPVGLTFRDYE